MLNGSIESDYIERLGIASILIDKSIYNEQMDRMKSRYMTAKEASGELKVSLATLYAYVSRGLVRSEAVAGSRRMRRYRREDVLRLQARQAQRRNPAAAAQHTLHWGLPVLELRLSLDRGRGAVLPWPECGGAGPEQHV